MDHLFGIGIIVGLLVIGPPLVFIISAWLGLIAGEGPTVWQKQFWQRWSKDELSQTKTIDLEKLKNDPSIQRIQGPPYYMFVTEKTFDCFMCDARFRRLPDSEIGRWGLIGDFFITDESLL